MGYTHEKKSRPLVWVVGLSCFPSATPAVTSSLVARLSLSIHFEMKKTGFIRKGVENLPSTYCPILSKNVPGICWVRTRTLNNSFLGQFMYNRELPGVARAKCGFVFFFGSFSSKKKTKPHIFWAKNIRPDIRTLKWGHLPTYLAACRRL